MLCKYCGRLASTKSKCLHCGMSLDGKSSSVKLTPEQIAEYELLSKQREEALLKAEQERIQKEQEVAKKKKELISKIFSYVGIGLAALVLVLFIAKKICLGSISIKNFRVVNDLSFNIGSVAFVISFFAAAALLVTAILKKKCGKKMLVWMLIAIVSIPLGFVAVTTGNNSLYATLEVVPDNFKTEYKVGEELNLKDVQFIVKWETGKEEIINVNDFEVVFLKEGEDNKEYNTIYVSDFDTSKVSSSNYVYFEIVLLYVPTETGSYGQSLTGYATYKVVANN